MTNPAAFAACFECIQQCLRAGRLQAGHDRSDGGLVVALLEMAFAGNCGLEVTLHDDWNTKKRAQGGSADPLEEVLPLLFSEECGFVFEVLPEDLEQVRKIFAEADLDVKHIGTVIADKNIIIRNVDAAGETHTVLQGEMTYWRDVWESTSFALEELQCDGDCVQQERMGLQHRTAPPSVLTFTPEVSAGGIEPADTGPCDPASLMMKVCGDIVERSVRHGNQQTTVMLGVPVCVTYCKHKVAVLRQEGTNGDREMQAAFHQAGFEVWDVNMHDLLTGTVQLHMFRGVVFCGGFSYADVNDSAKGWAGVIKFNPRLLDDFRAFRDRPDTFSLGVCNGCQLMALLGWVPFEADDPKDQTRLVHNTSGRFESRWSAVKVVPSPAVLLKGMEGSTIGILCYYAMIIFFSKWLSFFHYFF